ncbi:TonB-linked outer membrane protein, SusC/RagA family [Flavobacterium micromati]|uniref:TonB-linked outer membrane protein, SusC/RagA family n=1 Tax=Flavobacterium micromati TaxID=229205 RepID=A0A1M5QPG8_9FLAO|nr:TonB-dependent receptor [Flavobacterium micromati]SHH15818.1 TonB-linked outer membrane protein, SusC/RagA family [Flavobacterium micromati]
MKIKCKLLLSLIFALAVQLISAQESSISGKVTDMAGLPVPGANVIIKGTTISAQSNFDGEFVIKAKKGQTLVISFLGLKTIEITASDSMVVKLNDDASQLETVLVMGYGTQLKKRSTDAVSRVTAKDIENIPVSNIQNALVGKLAGVQITQTNGKVEGGMNIRVRGQASISAGTQPLYVLDGMILINQDESTNGAPLNPLLTLSPNEIESIDVLKDASSAAIYGARGANGVVIITTKKGKVGKTTFSANFSQGVSEATNTREFLNSAQYVELFTEARLNEGFSDPTGPGRKFDQLAAGKDWRNGEVDTDWTKQALRTGYVTDADFSASGGTDKTQYYFSGAYTKNVGILSFNELERFNFRNNITTKISDRFTAGMNMAFSRTSILRNTNDNSFTTPMQAIAQSPLSPARNDDGTANTATQYVNFLAAQDNGTNQTLIRRLTGKFFGEFKIIEPLKFNSDISYDLYAQTEDRWFGANYPFIATNGEVFASSVNNESYVISNYFTFDKSFSDHNLNIVAGQEFTSFASRFQSVTSIFFPSDALQTIDSGAEVNAGSGNETDYAFDSLFSRLSYSYANKYLFKASIRRDGSSRFGQNNQYGIFPAVSAGWVISEEAFLKDNSTLSNLKLRASYGQTGNAEIGNFSSRSLFAGASYNLKSGLLPSQPGNDNLSWEKSTQFDLGIEFGLLNNRISGEIDYYNKDTDGLLFDVPLAISSGASTITQNTGLSNSRGFEFVLNGKIIDQEDFQWNASLNVTTNQSKVRELPDNGTDIVNTFTIRRVGENINSFYLVEYAGVDPANGDALFVRNTELADGSLDKTTTNDYSEARRVVSGNPFATLMSGFTNTINYKGIDFSFTFQGEWGASIYNSGGLFQSANGDFWDNQTIDQLNRWQQPGDITNVPQARYLAGNGTQASTRYLDKSDFVRLRNLTLGYSLPKSAIEKSGLSRVRIYLTGVNLLTFTDYIGYDPEARADQGDRIGEEFYSVPPAKTVALGVNLTF